MVRRSRSWRSSRAPSMLPPRDASRVTSWRRPSFVMRLFLPVAGHHGPVPRWSIQKLASRTLAGRIRVTVGVIARRTYAGSASPIRSAAGYPRAMRSLVVLVALVAVAAAHAGTPPSEAEYHKLCRAIEPVHVRALFTAPTAIQIGGSQDCAFSPRGGNALV